LDKMNVNKTKISLLMEQHKINYTKSENKLYEYIKNNYDKVIYHSLTEMAEVCNVGEATVLRYCRKLGFKGYQELKFAVAQELSVMNDVENQDTYINKIKNNMIQAINDTYDLVDMNLLQQAIDKIDMARDVIVFGVGLSGICGLDMKSRFLRIGKNINVFTDAHFQVMRACSVTKETVIIAISLTGSTKDIVDAVSVAKKKGAYIISITNYIKSPLTKYSDLVLMTSAKENPLDGGTLVSKISQLYVIDLICTGIAVKNYDESRENKSLIAEMISGKFY